MTLLTVLASGATYAADAVPTTLRFASVFSDRAVLQREKPIPVWGWSAPGASVSVALSDQHQTAIADASGHWRVTFTAMKADAVGRSLTAVSSDTTVTLNNLLVGEVWLCSGQSNMEWAVANAREAKTEIATATYPTIRLLTIPKKSSAVPVTDFNATWLECSPATVGGFSAVGFFFGRELATTLNVPVGLIHASWGNTPAQSWTSHAALAAEPTLAGYATEFDTAMAAYPMAMAKAEAELTAKKTTAVKLDDSGWEKITEPDATTWKTMTLPQNWEKSGLKIDGTVWFLRTVDLPVEAARKDCTLSLGPIDDQDITWWDGEKIGATSTWNEHRNYTIPARAATQGRHVIAIRVVDTGGGGGIFGAPEQLSLTPAGGTAQSLAGEWKYRIAEEFPEQSRPPMGPGNPWLPTSLRNGMITPVLPYALRGAIWYQGESNSGNAWQYRTLFPAMIRDWRAAWGQGDFPFLFVQLANFTAAPRNPGDNEWAELRDAQFNTLRTVPATGMASAIDIGEAGDIHPKNKQDVGKRLARWALADTYAQKIESSGPLYLSSVIEKSTVRVRFDHLGGGLTAKDGPLKLFAIAGADRKWVWADAVIDGDSVVVSSPAVSAPVAVRYAWAANPAGCNLYNQAGLPASPFRTDSWPAITDRH